LPILSSGIHNTSTTLWAFDLLELNGEDPRQLPLDERKSKLEKLLRASRHSGIALHEHLEAADGARAWAHACVLRHLGFEASRQPIRVRPQQDLGEGQEPECARRAAVSGAGYVA
jgi:bifunctional non-homologous end joining protein LigD